MHVGPLFTLFLLEVSARPRPRAGPTVQAATDSQPFYSLSRVRDTVEKIETDSLVRGGRCIVYFSVFEGLSRLFVPWKATDNRRASALEWLLWEKRAQSGLK